VTERARQATRILKVLAHENRLRVLCRLVEGEKSFPDLEQSLGINRSTLSQHLSRLRHEKLIRTRRSSGEIYYSLMTTEATPIILLMYSMYCKNQDRNPTQASA